MRWKRSVTPPQVSVLPNSVFTPKSGAMAAATEAMAAATEAEAQELSSIHISRRSFADTENWLAGVLPRAGNSVSLVRDAARTSHCRCSAATPRTLDEVRACSDDDLPVAIAQLQTALAGDQSLHRLLAAAHARAGNLELAEPHARAALQREADDAEMLFVIGVAAEKRDEVLEAIDNFEAALEIEPDFWRPLFHLGKASRLPARHLRGRPHAVVVHPARW